MFAYVLHVLMMYLPAAMSTTVSLEHASCLSCWCRTHFPMLIYHLHQSILHVLLTAPTDAVPSLDLNAWLWGWQLRGVGSAFQCLNCLTVLVA
jgi:hypothetical protein